MQRKNAFDLFLLLGEMITRENLTNRRIILKCGMSGFIVKKHLMLFESLGLIEKRRCKLVAQKYDYYKPCYKLTEKGETVYNLLTDIKN